MKLLFDENISYRIVKILEDLFPECSHVKHHDLLQKDDFLVRDFAKQNEFIIVTNDSDFNDLFLLLGFPPKIIWLKTGNTSTRGNADLLIKHRQSIIDFSIDSENGILIIEK